jgi:hypothetical protein
MIKSVGGGRKGPLNENRGIFQRGGFSKTGICRPGIAVNDDDYPHYKQKQRKSGFS